MRAGDSADTINREAADWAARAGQVDSDPVLAAALRDWLAGDPRRRGAYLRAQAIWARVGNAAPSSEQEAGRDLVARRTMLAGGIAAALAASVGGLWLLGPSDRVYATRVGEQANAKLADGSAMLLNTDSAGTVAMTAKQRDVALTRGEARFVVAKDKARPFVVSAGAVRVEAVGTAFVVRRREGAVDVAIADGRVRIWSVRTPTRFLMLDAGHRVTVTDAQGADNAVVRADGMERALAWSKGMIALDNMTLAEAAAEFNRYNLRQIRVEQGLADRRLVGWFRAKDPDGFARSAAEMVQGRVDRDVNTIRIVR